MAQLASLGKWEVGWLRSLRRSSAKAQRREGRNSALEGTDGQWLEQREPRDAGTRREMRGAGMEGTDPPGKPSGHFTFA